MSGEPLERLSGRFWVISSSASDLAGEEGTSPPASGKSQGDSPFFLPSVSPSPNRSFSAGGVADSPCAW
jgi:hypothetical protein